MTWQRIQRTGWVSKLLRDSETMAARNAAGVEAASNCNGDHIFLAQIGALCKANVNKTVFGQDEYYVLRLWTLVEAVCHFIREQ